MVHVCIFMHNAESMVCEITVRDVELTYTCTNSITGWKDAFTRTVVLDANGRTMTGNSTDVSCHHESSTRIPDGSTESEAIPSSPPVVGSYMLYRSQAATSHEAYTSVQRRSVSPLSRDEHHVSVGDDDRDGWQTVAVIGDDFWGEIERVTESANKVDEQLSSPPDHTSRPVSPIVTSLSFIPIQGGRTESFSHGDDTRDLSESDAALSEMDGAPMEESTSAAAASMIPSPLLERSPATGRVQGQDNQLLSACSSPNGGDGTSAADPPKRAAASGWKDYIIPILLENSTQNKSLTDKASEKTVMIDDSSTAEKSVPPLPLVDNLASPRLSTLGLEHPNPSQFVEPKAKRKTRGSLFKVGSTPASVSVVTRNPWTALSEIEADSGNPGSQGMPPADQSLESEGDQGDPSDAPVVVSPSKPKGAQGDARQIKRRPGRPGGRRGVKGLSGDAPKGGRRKPGSNNLITTDMPREVSSKCQSLRKIVEVVDVSHVTPYSEATIPSVNSGAPSKDTEAQSGVTEAVETEANAVIAALNQHPELRKLLRHESLLQEGRTWSDSMKAAAWNLVGELSPMFAFGISVLVAMHYTEEVSRMILAGVIGGSLHEIIRLLEPWNVRRPSQERPLEHRLEGNAERPQRDVEDTKMAAVEAAVRRRIEELEAAEI